MPHAALGKLIVATSEAEIPGVEKIAAAARANGVDNLEWLSAREAQRLEPELRCVAALLSPSTGIIDSHALMLAYQGDAEAAGAFVAFRSPVLSGTVRGDENALGVARLSRIAGRRFGRGDVIADSRRSLIGKPNALGSGGA